MCHDVLLRTCSTFEDLVTNNISRPCYNVDTERRAGLGGYNTTFTYNKSYHSFNQTNPQP